MVRVLRGSLAELLRYGDGSGDGYGYGCKAIQKTLEEITYV